MEALWATILFSGFALEVIIRLFIKMKTKNNLRLEMEFYRLAAGDYRPLPELPNRTSPSRGPRCLKKYC